MPGTNYKSVSINNELIKRIKQLIEKIGCMHASILCAFGIRHRYFTEKTFDRGAISVKVFPEQDSINITGMNSSQNILRGYKCLIADDPLERIPKDIIVPLFAELEHLGIQIILTASPLIDAAKLLNNIHIITTMTNASN